MRRVSSTWTFFYKRVFPAIWFGFLVLFIGIAAFGSRAPKDVAIVPFRIVPLGAMAVGFFVMKKLVFDLVDEVWDDGDALVVKNGGSEERIALSEIKNVNYSMLVNPPRVTLALRRPTTFGEQIAFCAPLRLLPLTPSPVIADLVERIDRARQKQASR